jgi:hypothetical protein
MKIGAGSRREPGTELVQGLHGDVTEQRTVTSEQHLTEGASNASSRTMVGIPPADQHVLNRGHGRPGPSLAEDLGG